MNQSNAKIIETLRQGLTWKETAVVLNMKFDALSMRLKRMKKKYKAKNTVELVEKFKAMNVPF